MKVFITIPSFAVHGGIRVILEWANRLTEWHEVYLYNLSSDRCNWFDINPKVNIARGAEELKDKDCLIITSPHSIGFEDLPYCPKKVFIFCQMAEDLFRPDDSEWYNKCLKFYTSSHPMISISKWNIEYFESLGRTGKTYYVGNGVNIDHFPISNKPKDGKTILVEGWESLNPSKDPQRLGPKVAKILKMQGYKILTYSQVAKKTYPEVPDEYYVKPSLSKMNELYERATILVKASKFDARSCSPMEAMTKGTVTARAIQKGDDDLTEENSIRCGYDLESLYSSAKMLLDDGKIRNRLSKNCLEYVKKYNWDYWMKEINGIIN